MPEIIWTPYKATMKINKILDTVYPSLNERFPINIESLAKDILFCISRLSIFSLLFF